MRPLSVVEFVMLCYESKVYGLYWTLLLEKGTLKTITSLSHQAIVLANIIAYRTIGFLRHRRNPSLNNRQEQKRTEITHFYNSQKLLPYKINLYTSTVQ